MPNLTISQLPAAGPILGDELVPIVQNGQTLRTTAQALAASPSQTQTFLTLNQEPTLPNSRRLSGGTGIGLTDGGALSTLQIVLNGTSGALESVGTGIIVKTGAGAVSARSVAVSGTGLAVANADGVSGNPTLSLDGLISAIAQVGGTGLLAIQNGATAGGVQILGYGGQIQVSNGNGQGGNPLIQLVDNPTIPGTGGMVIPVGTAVQEPVGTPGQFRFNSTTQSFDGYAAGQWRQFSLAGGVTTFSAGNTGFTPATATSGAVTLDGILNPAHGGTGVDNGSSQITLGGNLTFSGAYATTMTVTGATSVTLPTTGTLATRAGTETFTNKTISGADNTLSNIGNSSLVNSSVTYNGVTVALGASGTITATTTNALTVSTGLQLNSGTTFDGSAAKTISIDSTVVTLTGTQTLTNKTLTTPVIAQISNTGTLTLPTSTDTLVGRATTDTLTNKSISGSANTLSNIGNASLTNSAITIGSTSVSLGGTITTFTGTSISGSTNTLSNIGNSSLTNSSISLLYTNGVSGDASVALGGTLNLSLTSVPNSSLANSSITIGTTTISLGGTSLTLGGLTSVEVTQDPTTALQLATKQYVDSVAQGLNVKSAVLWATTGNIVLSGLTTQAGGEWTGTLTVGDRILVKNQTLPAENGIYAAALLGWTRTSDANTWNELVSAFVFVQDGATLADTGWVCTVNPGGTLGTTAVTWSQFSGAGTYTAGTGLTLTGTQFSLTTPVAGNLGGTGLSSYTAGDLLYASNTTTLSKLALGTQGYVLKAGASGPEWGGISGGTF